MAAGDHYAELIKEQLELEDNRKQSLEQRAVLVITSAGALTTLLFGLAGLITGVEGFALPSGAERFLTASVALFLGSSILGILINRPVSYQATDEQALRGIVDDPDYWIADQVIGLRRVAENRLDMLVGARAANDKKASLLTIALGLEVAAVAMVAGAVIVIFIQ